MSDRIARHLVHKDKEWIVTIPAPGTAEEHVRLAMTALGTLLGMVVPAGRIGSHREVSRALLGLGVAVTVRYGEVESTTDRRLTHILRGFASEVAAGRRFDRQALVESLHEAARRLEGEK